MPHPDQPSRDYLRPRCRTQPRAVAHERIRRVRPDLIRGPILLDHPHRSSTTTRSATSNASSWSCVTKRLVSFVSSRISRSHSRSSFLTFASSAPNGSSGNSTRGADRQRPRQAHPLPLAARELRSGKRFPKGLQLHPLQQRLHPVVGSPTFDGRRFARAHPQAEGDVVRHRSCAGTARSAETQTPPAADTRSWKSHPRRENARCPYRPMFRAPR